jgi:hypothetical protein
MRDDRDHVVFLKARHRSKLSQCGQKVGSRKMLRGKHAIDGIERKLTPTDVARNSTSTPECVRQNKY